MKTIPLYLAGKWKISLLTGERENPLAMAEVAVGKEMGTVWMSWRESRMELWEERGDKDVIAVSRVSNPSGSFAIPSTFNSDGSFWISHDMDRKRPLPALFPDKVAANTKIRVGTDLLTVKIDRPREIMFPHDHFLTRWWVNGKPVCSDLKPEVIESARQWSGPVPHVNEFQFSIRFDAKVYGVKEGDGIGLQLLFCPFGWDHASSEADELSFLSVLEEAPEGISLLLPRAEFIWKEGKLQPKTAGGTGVGVNTDNEGKR